MPNFTSLPTELLSQVINHVIQNPSQRAASRPSTSDILSLCLVNHCIRDLAQPFLYSHLDVRYQSDAEKLATSDAFARYKVNVLELDGIIVDAGTAVELLKGAGKRGLRKVDLWYFSAFKTSDLRWAGPDLTTLDLTYVTFSETAPLRGCIFPFQLVHLGLHNRVSMSKSDLSHLLASCKSLESLDITFEAYSDERPPPVFETLFSLPEFTEVAARITSLAFTSLPTTHLAGLAPLSSLIHLNFHPDSSTMDIWEVFEVLKTLPSEAPTIKHLTLGLWKSELDLPAQQEWRKIINLKVLGKLELITWTSLSKDDLASLVDVLLGGRDVRMESEHIGEESGKR
ncbi:hypothetical protein P7C70_g3515, partial [Phenoliferia sp. Uapishka_3]